MLDVKSFIEIAKRITPNIFLVMEIPFSPIIFSILFDDLSTMYIKKTFIIMATIILELLYSAFNESSVVKLPGPAISGKDNGKTVAFKEFFSSL